LSSGVVIVFIAERVLRCLGSPRVPRPFLVHLHVTVKALIDILGSIVQEKRWKLLLIVISIIG